MPGTIAPFVLLAAVAAAAPADQPAPSTQPAPAKQPEPAPKPDQPAPETKQPEPAKQPEPSSPTKMMDDLERAAPPRPAPAQPTQPDAPAAAAPAQPAAPIPAPRIGGRLLREGAFLTGRRGRMVRADDGHWVFAFDNGPDSRTEPPMILLPCLTMAAMEKIAERAGDASTMSVSGQVFVYKGRNYLLPTTWQVNRRTDLVPNQ